MDERAMINLSTWPLTAMLPICFVGGMLLGYGYFRALQATTDLLVSQKPLPWILGLTLMRMGLLGAGFYLAAQAGAYALLAALAGVLLSKALLVRRLNRKQP